MSNTRFYATIVAGFIGFWLVFPWLFLVCQYYFKWVGQFAP